MMDWKKGLKLAGLGLMMTAACAGLSGCGGKGEGQGSGKTAKVGFINGVSGGVASYGLAEKEGFFTMQDVADGVKDKMVRRHPFVFDKTGKDSTLSAPREWEKRKRIEKNRKYLLSGVPKGLPSLLLTCIIQKKVSSNGLQNLLFPEDLPADMKQKISQFLEDDREMDREKKAGAFLFHLVHYLQEKGIEPELALHRSDTAFMSRLHSFEDFVMQEGKNLSDMSPEETLQRWKDFMAQKPSHWN